MKKIILLLMIFCFVGINAQNKYLKFETTTVTPYSTSGGVSTYLYPVGLGTTQSINLEKLQSYRSTSILCNYIDKQDFNLVKRICLSKKKPAYSWIFFNARFLVRYQLIILYVDGFVAKAKILFAEKEILKAELTALNKLFKQSAQEKPSKQIS
jgi:hypothetical protein